MKLLITALVLLGSVQAFAVDRECRAILLAEGVDNEVCLKADESLSELLNEHWNAKVCDTDNQGFFLGGRKFDRSFDSGNLWLDSTCTWEIRAAHAN